MTIEQRNSNETIIEEVHAVEGEFIANGEDESPKAKREEKAPRSKAEAMAQSYAKAETSRLDDEIANNELASEEVDRSYVKSVDFEQLMQNYQSITAQSNEYSSKIAETIHVSDLSEKSIEMLDETISTLDKMHHERTWQEKLVMKIPFKGARDAIGNALDVAERQSQRNSSVKDFAQAHFDELSKKQDFVNNNRISIDQIGSKLKDQDVILSEMLNQAKGALEYMSETGEGSKHDEIRGKQLVTRISNQLIQQRELVEQTMMYEGIAAAVSESIESALPQIKNEFIDQVSVTSSLRNLKVLQDSVKKTQEIILNLKADGLQEMNNILEEYEKEGVGESPKAREARKKNRILMEKLRQRSGNIDKNITKNLDNQIKENMDELEKSIRHDK
jgi:hypothetical protein